MGRPHRIQFPGAIYHVTTRGNWQKPIYLDDRDRELFLAIATDIVDRLRVICHAYCLMDNHYHLLVQTADANLAEAMHVLNGRYARAFASRHRRSGHVFAQRYHPVLIERQEHLLEVARYVVLNRVRARLCDHVAQWPWSSYAATAGDARRPKLLTVEWIIGQFAGSRERYRGFVGEGAPAASLAGLSRFRRRGTSCTSCRCRTSTARCGRCSRARS